MTAAVRALQLAHRPRAVIFDMDGLLLDTEALGERTWQRASRSTGIDFDTALLASMIGRNMRDTRAFLLTHYGQDYPVDRLTDACTAAFDAVVAEEGIALKPGVHELLDWLDAEDIARWVATSTHRDRAAAQLQSLGLLRRFAGVVGGNEVAHGKPAPDIFVEAAARLGATPVHCVVLEDSEPGVRAAIAAGIAPIMVPDLHPPSAALRALDPVVLPSLHHVRAHLSTLPPMR